MTKDGKDDKIPHPQDESLRLAIEEAKILTQRRIDGILQRSPPSLERIEALTAASRGFYLEAMERKRKRNRKQLAGLLGALAVIAGIWYNWFK